MDSMFRIEAKEESIGPGRWVEDVTAPEHSFKLIVQAERILDLFVGSGNNTKAWLLIPTTHSQEEVPSFYAFEGGSGKAYTVHRAAITLLCNQKMLALDPGAPLGFLGHTELPLIPSERGLALCRVLYPKLKMGTLAARLRAKAQEDHPALRGVDGPRGAQGIRRVWVERAYPRHHFELTRSEMRALVQLAHNEKARIFVPTVMRTAQKTSALLAEVPGALGALRVHPFTLEQLFNDRLLALEVGEEVYQDLPIYEWLILRLSPLGRAVARVLKAEADGVQPVATEIHHDAPGKRGGRKDTPRVLVKAD